MPSSDDLKSYLPPFLSNTEIFTELFVAEGAEFDNLSADVSDIKAQFDPTTATWAMDTYEKELGITTNTSKPLAYRASVVMSKNHGEGKLNSTLLATVCDAFTNGNVQVTFDGTIHIKFTSVLGVPPNMTDLESTMALIKPAYLFLDYAYAYLLISNIDQLMTIATLDSTLLNEFAGGS